MTEQPEDIRRQHFTAPLGAFVDFVQEADQILDISIRGIGGMRALPRAIKVLAKVEPSEYTNNQLARAEEMARLAEQESNNEFPLLHAHTVVAIWSALEASIPKFAARWLAEKPYTLARPAFERIKVPVGLYQQTGSP